jgi:hypothetical protein|tara:strand:+ start:117 stop:281 length:165 start_codon:yes stop_codon:yes gene_type:complete
MLPEHRSLVQGVKTYETAGHDKGITTVENLTTDTTLPAVNLETRSKVDSLNDPF